MLILSILHKGIYRCYGLSLKSNFKLISRKKNFNQGQTFTYNTDNLKMKVGKGGVLFAMANKQPDRNEKRK